MADKDWVLMVSDLDNPDSEISEALTQHAQQAVPQEIASQVQSATTSASAAQTSAASAATSATQAVSAAQTATTMAGQTVALQDEAVATLLARESSETRAKVDTVITSQVSPVASDVAALETLTTTGRLGEAELSATFGRAAEAAGVPVSAPEGFTWTDNPLAGTLFVDQYGRFFTTIDPTVYKTTGGATYYVDIVNGSDSNPGTAGSPLKYISAAAAKSDVTTIMVKGYGLSSPYPRTAGGFSGGDQTRNLNIIGYGDDAPVITTHDVLTWTLASGKTNAYQTTRTNVTEIVDMLTGLPGVRLEKVESVDAVEATPGSWYATGGTVTVHAPDSRNLNTTSGDKMWALLNANNLRVTGDYNTYVEDVILYGGNDVVRVVNATTAGGRLVMVNVETAYSQVTWNNVSTLGIDSILINCDTHHSGGDGYNYHAQNGRAVKAIEIDCRAYDCGHAASDQCSTSHDGAKVIRVNGTYLRATAANIADINAGTESWNLGCRAIGAGYGFANFQAGVNIDTTGTPMKMWFHGCDTGDARLSVSRFGLAQIANRGSRLEHTFGSIPAY